jgi:hypothetical protein
MPHSKIILFSRNRFSETRSRPVIAFRTLQSSGWSCPRSMTNSSGVGSMAFDVISKETFGARERRDAIRLLLQNTRKGSLMTRQRSRRFFTWLDVSIGIRTERYADSLVLGFSCFAVIRNGGLLLSIAWLHSCVRRPHDGNRLMMLRESEPVTVDALEFEEGCDVNRSSLLEVDF